MSLITGYSEVKVKQDTTVIHLIDEMKNEINSLKQELQELKSSMVKQKRPTSLLTKRENDVYRLLSEGKTNLFIANHLEISEKTVKNHVSRIIKKLKVKNRTEAVILSYKLRAKA